MGKKLSLEDLKVQTFVTTLEPAEAALLVGGTRADTECASTHACGGTCTAASNCCDSGGCSTNDAYCYSMVGTGCSTDPVNCPPEYTYAGYPGCG